MWSILVMQGQLSLLLLNLFRKEQKLKISNKQFADGIKLFRVGKQKDTEKTFKRISPKGENGH